jgi:L-alanine-DL-glutamate epimerase-like enolase superfamily enzyme
VAALVHVLATLPVPVLTELAGGRLGQPPYLPEAADFREGKLWPVDRPGLGVTFDPAGAELVAEIMENDAPIPMYRRPDGSITNW